MMASTYACCGGGETSHQGQSFAKATTPIAQRRNNQANVTQTIGPRNRFAGVSKLVVFT